MEIVEGRHSRASMIIISQLPVNCRPDIIGEKPIADAILDRIVHDPQHVELQGRSHRKIRDQNKKMEMLN